MATATGRDALPHAIRHRFPLLERQVYLNSCSQGVLSDAVRAGLRGLPAGLGREGRAVGVLDGAHGVGAARASPGSWAPTTTRSPSRRRSRPA